MVVAPALECACLCVYSVSLHFITSWYCTDVRIDVFLFRAYCFQLSDTSNLCFYSSEILCYVCVAVIVLYSSLAVMWLLFTTASQSSLCRSPTVTENWYDVGQCCCDSSTVRWHSNTVVCYIKYLSAVHSACCLINFSTHEGRDTLALTTTNGHATHAANSV